MEGKRFGMKERLSIEKHFKQICENNPDFEVYYNIWKITKLNLKEHLNNSRNSFSMFSLHDFSHSESIILAIERYLGEKNISELSLTDSFLILVSCYAHDIGMAIELDKVFGLLQEEEYLKFIEEYFNEDDETESKYVSVVQDIYQGNRTDIEKKLLISYMYMGILLSFQNVFRKTHAEGIGKISEVAPDVKKIKGRFIRTIIDIGRCHGKDFSFLMQLEFEEDGFCHDLMHPRYIAALLRIGDLLDIDNDRFTDWFKKAMENNGAFIPKTIKLHYLKHQATSTIYITPSLIRVYSDVRIENHFEALQVADLIGEWFLYIKSDFDKLKYNWAEITHGYFGAGPGVLDLKIWLNGLPYEMEKQKITLSYSHRFLEKLAEGKDLYSNSYTGFRELLQNSVDASLLKLWQDVKNHCVDSLLPKDFIDKLDSIPSDIKDQKKAIDDLKINFYDLREKVFNNYPIEVHLVNDSMNEQIIIVIHDYGIGFTKENIKYIAQVGSDKENSPVFKNLISSMPEWLYPAGYFGIGIQSVFTLTDQLEYFSFNTAGSNLHIIIRDNKCSERTIQFIEMDSEFSKQNFKNKNRGTYTVLKLKYNKYFKNHNYIYFDATFNEKAKPENAALREIVSAFRGLRDNGKGDYFSIKYREWERKYINGVLDYSEINNTKGNIKRNSFFMKEYNILGIQNVGLKSKGEDFNLAFHFPSIGCWDWKTNYYWAFDITLFEIVNNKIFFPPTTAHPITLLYKFLKIKDISSLKGEEDFRRVRYSRFVHTTVNIFSKDVSEYLTIDRERLKNTSLQEKDINEYFYNCIRTLWRELIEGKQSVDVFLKIYSITAEKQR